MKTKIHLLLLLGLLLLTKVVSAQDSSKKETGIYCGFDAIHKRLLKDNNEYFIKNYEAKKMIYDILKRPQGDAYRLSPANYTLPVVVHIIHNGGTENITDAQVIAGISHMNDAYEHVAPYDGANGVDTKIEFCLAKQDPDGNPSTGINRVTSPLTDHQVSNDLNLKNLIRWDPTNYINIWLVKEICDGTDCGTAGYAYPPAVHGTATDGIVCESRFFGSNKTESKVHIHETGHYLDLYHTFEGGCPNVDCLIYGDGVCDTPPDNSMNTGLLCGMTENSCTTDSDDPSTNNPYRAVASGGLGDQNDMLTNFMDYANLVCENKFTLGQRDRMHAAITGPRNSLLDSKACLSTCATPISVSFTVPSTTVNAGTIVNFTNTSSGATAYTWEINGTNFSSATNPSYSFNSMGEYTIKLTAENGNINCTVDYSVTIQVTCPAKAAFTASASLVDQGQTVTFTNTNAEATSFIWKADDVVFSNSQNSSYTFNTPGNILISLIVSNGICNDTVNKIIRVVNPNKCNLNSKFANIWFFGYNAGIDFNSGTPVSLAGSKIETDEGVATIADENGQLLFYTDGITVWDRVHNVMPNGTGLLGHKSATQSAVVVPKPGTKTGFYIFTVDDLNSYYDEQVTYSEVDMTLNGGLGDVVATKKNIFVHKTASEKISASMHANGCDVWVVTYDLKLAQFHSHLINSSGVSLNNVISNGVINYSGSWDNSIGTMRISPNGAYLGICFVDAALDLFDFNNSTGTVSNQRRIYTIKPGYSYIYAGPYGIEFSPDNSKLYISTSEGNRYIHQFNLNAGSTANIIASEVILVNQPSATKQFGALQLGPDGKIYISRPEDSYLHVIPFPNLSGSSAGFIQNAVALPSGSVAKFGLPNFITSNFQSVDFDYTCGSNVTTFTPTTSLTDPVGYTWYFGEPGSGNNDTSYIQNPTHTYAAEGKYKVTLTIDKGCFCRTFIKEITVPSYCSLPITLFDFNAHLKNENEVFLNWSTLTERNASHFEIERSINGIDFYPIGIVKASGNSNYLLNYSLNDRGFSNEQTILYYRLKMIDFDKSFEYSKIAYVLIENLGTDIQIYPNPATNYLNIKINRIDEGNISLADVLGRNLIDKKIITNNTEMNFDISGFSSGTYILKVISGNGMIIVKKFIKQ